MQNECLELIEKRNDAESRFLSSDSDLVKKKSKYFAEYPIEKWQLTGDYDAINIKTNKKEVLLLLHFTVGFRKNASSRDSAS
jgi:hypothetical protein